MTSLAEIQEQFQAFLLGGCRDIERLTVGSDRLPARERLAVYADAYRLRLLEVLMADFPGLHGMIGDESFEALGAAYVDAHRSDHPSVRWYGRRLAGFLRSIEPYRTQPLLAEMAEFEWAQGEVLDGVDSPAVRAEALGGLAPGAWPRMGIEFQSALRRLDLHWNVPVLWQAVHDGAKPPPQPRRVDAPVSWLLWRRDLKVHWRSLDDVERRAMDAARGGCSFGAMCEALLAHAAADQVPRLASGYLKRWVTDELVARIDY